MSGAGDGMGDIIGQASARDVEGNYKKVGDKKGPFVGALCMDGHRQAAFAGHGAWGCVYGAAERGVPARNGAVCAELHAVLHA